MRVLFSSNLSAASLAGFGLHVYTAASTPGSPALHRRSFIYISGTLSLLLEKGEALMYREVKGHSFRSWQTIPFSGAPHLMLKA